MVLERNTVSTEYSTRLQCIEISKHVCLNFQVRQFELSNVTPRARATTGKKICYLNLIELNCDFYFAIEVQQTTYSLLLWLLIEEKYYLEMIQWERIGHKIRLYRKNSLLQECQIRQLRLKLGEIICFLPKNSNVEMLLKNISEKVVPGVIKSIEWHRKWSLTILSIIPFLINSTKSLIIMQNWDLISPFYFFSCRSRIFEHIDLNAC